MPEQMTTAEAVVAALIAHGVETVYALPGIQNDHLFDALYRAQNRVRTIHTRHEQGSAYMALGAALATGKPQAFAVVPGPGLLNASAALLTAYSMNAPVLALTGEFPSATSAATSATCTSCATRPASSRGWSTMRRISVRPPMRRASSPRRCARWRAAGAARPPSPARSTPGARADP